MKTKYFHFISVLMLTGVLIFSFGSSALGSQARNEAVPCEIARIQENASLDFRSGQKSSVRRNPQSNLMAERTDTDALFEKMKAVVNGSPPPGRESAKEPETRSVDTEQALPTQAVPPQEKPPSETTYDNKVLPSDIQKREWTDREAPRTSTATLPGDSAQEDDLTSFDLPDPRIYQDTGILIVTTNIKDAIIRIDRKEMPPGAPLEDAHVYSGGAPFESNDMPSGVYEVRVTGKGFRESIRTVNVRSGVMLKVNVMDEQAKDVPPERVAAKPQNPEMPPKKVLDAIEQPPKQEPPVKLSMPPSEQSAQTAEQKPWALPDQETRKATGSLIVRTDIDDARILISKRMVSSGPQPDAARVYRGRAPFESQNMAPGPYEVRVIGDGYQESIRNVEVRSGEVLILNVTKE